MRDDTFQTRIIIRTPQTIDQIHPMIKKANKNCNNPIIMSSLLSATAPMIRVPMPGRKKFRMAMPIVKALSPIGTSRFLILLPIGILNYVCTTLHIFRNLNFLSSELHLRASELRYTATMPRSYFCHTSSVYHMVILVRKHTGVKLNFHRHSSMTAGLSYRWTFTPTYGVGH